MRRKVPFIPQVEAADCGAAALAAILAYHGRWERLAQVREQCPASRDGASALTIVRAAEAFGLNVDAFKTTFDELRQVALPSILFWNFKHFVVLEAIDKRHVTIVDPGAGRVRVPLDAAARAYSGAALAFSPSAAFVKKKRERASVRPFARELAWCRTELTQAIVLSLCIQLLALSVPAGTKLLLDSAHLPSLPASLIATACVLVAASVAGTWLGVLRGFLLQNVQSAVDFRMAAGVVRHLLALPFTYFLQRRSGDVMQRMHRLEMIRETMTAALSTSLLDLFLVALYVAFAFAMSPAVATTISVFCALHAVVVWRGRTATSEMLNGELAADGNELTAFIEAFTALETIRAARAESYVINRWRSSAIRKVNAATSRRRVEGYEQAARDALTLGGLVAIIGVGAYLLENRAITEGTLAALLVLNGMMRAPVESVLNAFAQLQHLERHASALEDITLALPERSGSRRPEQNAIGVELRNVSFRYAPSSPNVVSNVSLSLAPGEHIALVGPSGAGKSTIARMLVGLIPPTYGTIEFGGIPLAAVDLEWLRTNVAIVLQDTTVLDDDVLANLCLYRPRAPLADVRQAAAMAVIDEVIERLDGGYAHRLHANGTTLSGGERQRLSIARALLARPSILVLDEATSALDSATEARVLTNIAKAGITRVTVAHRLDTVRNADRIYVFDRGAVVEQGTYEELIGNEHGLLRRLALARV